MEDPVYESNHPGGLAPCGRYHDKGDYCGECFIATMNTNNLLEANPARGQYIVINNEGRVVESIKANSGNDAYALMTEIGDLYVKVGPPI